MYESKRPRRAHCEVINNLMGSKKHNTFMSIAKTILLGTVLGLLSSVGARAADNPALMQPVKSVYDNYLKIQTALAGDSMTGVTENAGAIAKAVEGDQELVKQQA